MDVQSKGGGGTKMTITLPVNQLYNSQVMTQIKHSHFVCTRLTLFACWKHPINTVLYNDNAY